MGRIGGAPALLLTMGCGMLLGAQTRNGEPVVVSTEHPRLFLRPARLRLLRRERERQSTRFRQFEALISGNAPMPERGFARALYYQISGNAEAGRQAIAWALGPGKDLRQRALVFDWCQDLMSEGQRQDLAARLQSELAGAAGDDRVATVRSRVLAAVALFDHVPQGPPRELEAVVRKWWEGKIVPALAGGHAPFARDDAYPLFELLHAMRDNANLDLRESCPRFFEHYPIEHLLSYYPAVYEAAENAYYIGAMRHPGEPGLEMAALSRAADLAMVAYDANAPQSQVLQGWLMHDRFMLRGTFGAPYEFLWANPYQPGLSYYHVPLVFHDPGLGRLFARSSWDDSARWFGCFEGTAQLFEDGHPVTLDPRRTTAPISLEPAVVVFGQSAHKFHVRLEEQDAVFVVGLEPRHTYKVEIDDREMFEAATDPGGILELDEVPHGKDIGVRIK